MEPAKLRLGEVLLSQGVLTEADLASALAQQSRGPRSRLGAVLLDMGLASESDVARGLATLHGLPLLDVEALDIQPDVARTVPRSLAHRLGILAYALDGQRLLVAVADPVDVVALDDIRRITGALSLGVGVAERSAITLALAQVWDEAEDRDVVQAFVEETAASMITAEVDDPEAAATIRLVDRLLDVAVRERASDLHLEPHRGSVLVRLRVDGVLHEVLQLPPAGYSAVTARLKIIAGLDIIERRVPQDGRARIRVAGGIVDVRVSTVPAMHGEKIVVRILPSASRLPDLHGLGLTDDQRDLLLEVMSRPQGLVLITGPTGSGKTNTLYAALAEGVDGSRNVMTLEDPVEIELPGITQIQIDDKSGLSFARALRACLRQDPDVLLVGEIRDQDTADLAVRAALTGHLVLATLHTLDAAAAITRLADMGVAPYLVTSSLALVVSQRLVRLPCPECVAPDPTAPEVLRQLSVDDVEGTWVRAVGCPACTDTGYRGRTAVLEMLPVTEALRAALLVGANEARVRAIASDAGHVTLYGSGLNKARAGQTTLAEVLRAVPRGPAPDERRETGPGTVQ
jgi:type IV pilus assembly protein PilB